MSNLTTCHSFTDERREEVTRAILDAPPEQANQSLADRLEISRETVRRVRFGLMWVNVLPHLERLNHDLRVRGRGLTCELCVHWTAEPIRQRIHGQEIRRNGTCGLGIPESTDNRFARGCGAFVNLTP